MDQSPPHPVRTAALLASSGVPFRLVGSSREEADAEFAAPVITPFGPIEIDPSAIDQSPGAVSLLGLIRPILERPTFVVQDASASASFHRVILGPDGAARGHGTVSLVGGRVRVSVEGRPPALMQGDGLPPGFGLPTLEADLNADLEPQFSSCAWPVDDDLAKSVTHGVTDPSGVTASVTRNGLPVTLLVVTDFDLAMHFLGASSDLVKSEHGAIPPDARWITVHPNGPGTKGQPILVVPAGSDGSYRVIGGAGGKLNMLKLRGVKSESSYRQEHADRAAAKVKARKDQIAKDKSLGLHEAKEKARKGLFEQQRAARKSLVNSVAEAMGWDQSALELDTSELTPDAAKRAIRRHEAELFRRAREAVHLQRKALVADAEKRDAAGLSNVPFTAAPDALGVEDLEPGRVPDQSGVSISFGQMATDAGLTPEAVAAKKAELAAASGKMLDPEALADKAAVKKAIDAELEKLAQPSLSSAIVDAQKSVALIKQLKAVNAIDREAAKARAEIDASTVEPKAYVLATSEPSDADVSKLVAEDVATQRAAAFLADVDRVGSEDDLRSHVSAGAYNAINALQQVVGGDAIVDRALVDVLGIAGTARVLAARLHSAYGEKAKAFGEAVAAHHVETAAKQQQEAMAQAAELQDLAASIELDAAHGAGGLVEAAALNQKRLDALGEARKVLGQVLGEQEARASLVAALEQPPAQFLDVSLGKAGVESAMQQLYAIGLQASDFSIEKVAGNMFARIGESGLDRLARQVDHDNLDRLDRNLAIMKGAQDEDDWLPAGFATRADLGLDLKPGVAPRMAGPFDASAPDLHAALRSYIGARTADGDTPADILADVQSASFFQKVGQARAVEYGQALDAAIPTKKADGKLVRVEDLAPVFEGYADAHVASLGGTRSTLNRQKITADALSQEALHRALAAEPAGKLAYRPIGELSLSERGKLRDWFFANVAHESPEQADLRKHVEKLAAAEPEKTSIDMFGEAAPNPAWADWKVEHDEAAQKAANAKLDWPRYAKMMGGPVKALETVQDLVRSRVSEHFAEAHNRLRPHAPIAMGNTVVRNNLRHLGAVDPAEREKRLSMERSLVDSLRKRVQGKYAGGSIAEKIDEHKSYEAAFGQAQMGFFSSEELSQGPGGDGPPPVGAGERRTIGHAAETMLGKMMGVVGKQFEPGQPVKLFKPTMSGPDGVKRQRAIKLIEQNKRVALGAGVGSGKTAMMLGAFSHLHSKGAVKKGIFVVPSIVQGQFGAEALRFLEPGKFNWHAEPGAPYADRLASYKDPENHFTVVTHQSFRDDLLRMAVEAGKAKSMDEASSTLKSLSGPERKAWMGGVLAHHGISPDYLAVDEGHGLLDREGKDDSGMSAAIGAVSDQTEHYVHASGDPVKNDASEAHSLLQKMDPERYADRDAFMRRYGGDTLAAKEGLQRELARHLYTFALTPDVDISRQTHEVDLSPEQHEALAAIDKHVGALRMSALQGKPDVAAAKALSPHLFDGLPEEHHAAVAERVAKSAGIIKDSAVRRVIDNHPTSAKLDAISQMASERKGKQGVVFAHSLDAVEAIRSRLEAEGHRVITLTGADSSADKAAKLRKYTPDAGEPEADIVVASDAGATGANMQAGAWLAQYDVPQTAMTHAQRNGRIARIGQKQDVELLDVVAKHESEDRARKRLSRKYGLRDLMTTPLDGIDDTGLAYHLKASGAHETAAQASFL